MTIHMELYELAGTSPNLHPERKGQLNKSKLKNWVEKNGGLPTYINSFATAILRSNPGWTIQRVIKTAVSQVKKICATGKSNFGVVKKAVQTAACAAVAKWEKMKVSASNDDIDDVIIASYDDPLEVEVLNAQMRKDYRAKGQEIPEIIDLSDDEWARYVIELSDDEWDYGEGVEELSLTDYLDVLELSANVQSPMRTPVVGQEIEASETEDGTYEKEVLRVASIDINGRRVNFTPDMLKGAHKNFKENIFPTVNAQYVLSQGEHTDDPRAYAGQVVDTRLDNVENPTKLYAKFKLTDEAKKIIDHNPKFGASVKLHPNFVDNQGVYRGSTLMHVAITPRPRVDNMEEWRKTIAASDEQDGTYDLSDATFDDGEVITTPIEGGVPMADKKEGTEQNLPFELSAENIEAIMASQVMQNAIAKRVADETAAKDERIVELSTTVGKLQKSSYENIVDNALNTYRTGEKAVPPIMLDYAKALMLSFDEKEQNETIELSVSETTGEGKDAKTEEKTLNLSKAGLVTKMLEEAQGFLDLSGETGSEKEPETHELSADAQTKAVMDLVALTNPGIKN